MYHKHATVALFVMLSACGEAAPPTPPSKEELSKRLNESRSLPPEARVNIYCGDRVSNLCDKLRSEPSYRNKWLATMDSLEDTRVATDKAQVALEREKARMEAELEKMIANQPKLPDGTPVFLDKEGKYRDDKGNYIPPELARTAR